MAEICRRGGVGTFAPRPLGRCATVSTARPGGLRASRSRRPLRSRERHLDRVEDDVRYKKKKKSESDSAMIDVEETI